MRPWLSRLLPPDRRHWGDALLGESHQIESGPARARWLLGGGRILLRSWLDWMRGGNLMKTVVLTLSVMVGAMGLLVLVVMAIDRPQARVVPLIATALLVQGGYTIAYVLGRLRGRGPWPGRLLLAGAGLALVAGCFGFTAAVIQSIEPAGNDVEYAPLAISLLMGMHAASVLWAYATPNDPAQTGRARGQG